MSFQFVLSGEYQLNFDLNFKRALQDITTEEGYYVLESFFQNFKVVFWYLYIYCIYTNIYYIYISYICIYMIFSTEGFFKVAIESWPEWDLNSQPLKSIYLSIYLCIYLSIYLSIYAYIYIHIIYIYVHTFFLFIAAL